MTTETQVEDALPVDDHLDRRRPGFRHAPQPSILLGAIKVASRPLAAMVQGRPCIGVLGRPCINGPSRPDRNSHADGAPAPTLDAMVEVEQPERCWDLTESSAPGVLFSCVTFGREATESARSVGGQMTAPGTVSTSQPACPGAVPRSSPGVTRLGPARRMERHWVTLPVWNRYPERGRDHHL